MIGNNLLWTMYQIGANLPCRSRV